MSSLIVKPDGHAGEVMSTNEVRQFYGDNSAVKKWQARLPEYGRPKVIKRKELHGSNTSPEGAAKKAKSQSMAETPRKTELTIVNPTKKSINPH